MSLNTIELVPHLLTELYTNSLLDAAAFGAPAPPAPGTTPETAPRAQKQPGETPPALYKYLGNNGRKITFLVNAPGSAYLPDDQLAFLTKMLEACKMNMGDLALVNHAGNPVSIDTLKPQLQPGIMVLFGVDPLQIRLPINFPQFKIQAFDGCQYLFTPPLEQLMQPTEEGKLLKTKLWVSLKTLFGV